MPIPENRNIEFGFAGCANVTDGVDWSAYRVVALMMLNGTPLLSVKLFQCHVAGMPELSFVGL